ncbi:MAG: hypothetical protein L0H94_15890, partial [Nitrospira sp.]|nr:hypothetical protein [Nitrospira sp.]
RRTPYCHTVGGTGLFFLTPREHTSTLPEYGLTVICIQRYKILTGTYLFDCLLIVPESAPAYPTLREWRNWQTRGS